MADRINHVLRRILHVQRVILLGEVVIMVIGRIILSVLVANKIRGLVDEGDLIQIQYPVVRRIHHVIVRVLGDTVVHIKVVVE